MRTPEGSVVDCFGSTQATLTRGAFSATAARDNVLELVFSDAAHRHYAQPEVVRGRFRN